MKKSIRLLLCFLGFIMFSQFALSQNSAAPVSANSTNKIEVYAAKLKAEHIIKKVQEQTGATKEEIRLFVKFYQDSILGHDRSQFGQAVLHGKIKTDADVKAYAAKKIARYVAMFHRFETLRKNAPSVVNDKLIHRALPPVTCDTGCNNKDFSDGTLANWTACYAENTSVGTSSSSGSSGSFSNTAWTCFGPLSGGTTSAYDPSTSSYQVSITSGSGFDPIAGSLIPVVCPGGSPYSCMVGDGTTPNYGMAMIEQTFYISATQPYFNYGYAVLLENPSHPYYEQPYFEIIMLDQNGDTIPGCGQYYVVSAPGLPGYTSFYYPTNGDTVYAKPWTLQYVSLHNYIGTCITVKVIAADCAAGAHFGYGYFDAFCSAIVPISSSPAVCGNTNVTLTAPPGAQAYEWLGPPCFTGPTNTQTTTVNCSGTYSVVVVSTLSNPCPDTLSISITAAPAFNFNLVSTTNNLCNGDSNGSATTIASLGSTPYTYSWSPAVTTNSSASNLAAGTYTISARDHNGCLDSIVVTITQPPAMTATMSITQPPCGVSSGAASISIGGGMPAYTYSWSPSGGTSSTATALSAGNYTVTVTDAQGCTVTSTAVVSTLTPLTVTATVTNIACSGGSSGTATANASNGTNPYTYSWSPSGGTNVTATGLSAGTYTVFVTDINGCSGFASVTIVQSNPMSITTSATPTGCGANTGTVTANVSGGIPAYTYSWTPSGNSNASANGLSAGTYTVTVTDANGCTITSAATVNQPSSLSISTTTSPSNCGGSNGSASVTVTGGTPVYTYSWSSGGTISLVSGLSPGTYTITVTDANGCFQTASAVVGAGSSQPLTVSLAGGALLCSGSTATLIATTNGGIPSYSFLWSPGGNSTQIITVAPSVTTTYTFQVTDGCGTIVTDTVTVFVTPSPLVSFWANPTAGCEPLCIQFYNTTSIATGSVAQYKWSFGNGDTASGRQPIYCYNTPGSYNITLTATSDKGCSSSLTHSDMINVYPRPIANFTYSPNPISILSPLVQFTDNSSSQNPIIFWSWDFGDGSNATSSLKNPSYLYSDTGTYCVTLYVGDMHGCIDTATNCLVVEPIFTLYIPDAFSPNGDGVNDYFLAKGSYIKDFEMYIFDRWGMELFHSTDIMKGWNGRVGSGSSICQEDAYVYSIKVTDARGIKHTYTGTVNLLK